MAERYVVDVATNTILLFPDHLSLVIISEADDAGEVTLTAEAKLSADPKSLVSLPGSRQIILGDAFFILRRPDSTKVIDFGFFPTGGLSGRLTLTAKKQDFQLIRKKIFGDPSFMEPEYSGRSETFESEVEIASVGLSPLDIESIRGKKFLIPQTIALLERMRENIDPADLVHVEALAEKLINEVGHVDKIEERWSLILPVGGKKTKIIETKSAVIPVFGDKNSIKLS